MLEAISMKDKYEQLKLKANEKKRNESQELHNVLAGKTTLKGVFSVKKKEDQASNLEKSLSQVSFIHNK